VAIRFGLAGLGIHGSRYARHLLHGDVPGAELAAVSRADATAGEAFAEEHSLDFLANPLDLAARPGLDAVVLALRPDLHAPCALACLEARRPVLVEKPLAHDEASARTVARRAHETGVPLMVAHTQRFDALVARIRQETASLGAIRVVSIHQRFRPAPRGWFDDPVAGGALRVTGVHGFDLLRFLTGAEIVSIHAQTGRQDPGGADDRFAASLRLEPGAIVATVDNAFSVGGPSMRVEVACESGQVHGDLIHRTLTRIVDRRVEDLGLVPDVPTVAETLNAFVRCLTEKVPVPISAEDGLEAVRWMETALRTRT
jgi:myo-inositol 2-dehydrogenase/D-chiro-inositol 1-dehydrogenase